MCTWATPTRSRRGPRAAARTAADIPQSKYIDLAAVILGVEPEYAFDIPSDAWLRQWFFVSLFGVMGVSLLAVAGGAAGDGAETAVVRPALAVLDDRVRSRRRGNDGVQHLERRLCVHLAGVPLRGVSGRRIGVATRPPPGRQFLLVGGGEHGWRLAAFVGCLRRLFPVVSPLEPGVRMGIPLRIRRGAALRLGGLTLFSTAALAVGLAVPHDRRGICQFLLVRRRGAVAQKLIVRNGETTSDSILRR